jgi:hypothetical protein
VYEPFNELVAARLGQVIGLPVPAGITVERGGNVYFCSCNIGAAGGDLPEADFARFATEKAGDACGVTVFDAWIANTDRHNSNLWYDYYNDRFVIFDHGRALLNGSGRVHLQSNRDRLGVLDDERSLSHHVTNFASFRHWHQRILEIPEYAIFQWIGEAAAVGVDPVLARECATWLVKRRVMLPDLFRNGLASFPKYQPSVFDPFGDCDDPPPEYYI